MKTDSDGTIWTYRSCTKYYEPASRTGCLCTSTWMREIAYLSNLRGRNDAAEIYSPLAATQSEDRLPCPTRRGTLCTAQQGEGKKRPRAKLEARHGGGALALSCFPRESANPRPGLTG